MTWYKEMTEQQKREFKKVITVSVTGVNYLYHASGYSGGMTPLLDREGKPVVAPVINR